MWPGEETGGIWTLAFSVCLCDSSAPTGVGYQGKILIQTDHSSMLGVPSGHSLKRDARQAAQVPGPTDGARHSGGSIVVSRESPWPRE